MNESYFFLILLTIFRIVDVDAHVELTYPEGGESFFSGDTVTIQWTEVAFHNGQNWELYYSPDGGQNWDTIAANIAYSHREYQWIVPFHETTTGRIMVVQNNPDADYQDQCANFSIDNISGIGPDQSVNLLFESFRIFPNPVHTNTNLNFTIEQEQQVSISIHNMVGVRVDKIQVENYLPGTYNVQWNSEGIKSGTYFCRVNTGKQAKTFKMQIVD